MFVTEEQVASWTCCVGSTNHGSESFATANETGFVVAGWEERSSHAREERFDDP